ncbi:MAG: DNA cytosine methyltransferase, partial [Thermoanaerobaculaceae bacterium]
MRKALSVYTGAGGLDLGFEAAGFETVAAVEIDPEAVATLRANRAWPVIDRDIHWVTSQEILATAGLREGEADVLIGGPPCQPFSKSGVLGLGGHEAARRPTGRDDGGVSPGAARHA